MMIIRVSAVFPKLVRYVIYGFIATLISIASYADDIEVYGSNTAGNSEPNVLFIIDRSGSMLYGTDGMPAATAAEEKIDILRNVFKDVLADSRGKINASVVFFHHDTTGIKWPVSDLTKDASLIDSDILTGTTVEQVLVSLVDDEYVSGETNYLAPLMEAARYFRGEQVWYNRWTSASSTEPRVWDSVAERYDGGASHAPSQFAYFPQDAYKPGSTGPSPDIGTCYDYQAYDAAASNGCASLELVPSSCVYNPSYTYTPAPHCPVSEDVLTLPVAHKVSEMHGPVQIHSYRGLT